MELDFAFLADSADVSAGKLFVLGGAFDTIYVARFPVSHPLLAVALRLLLGPSDLEREHTLEIQLRDADGKMIANAQGQLRVPKSPDTPAGWKQAVILPLRFFNVPFENPGHYSFEILMNTQPVKAIPLRVVSSSNG